MSTEMPGTWASFLIGNRIPDMRAKNSNRRNSVKTFDLRIKFN